MKNKETKTYEISRALYWCLISSNWFALAAIVLISWRNK
jgi:hypothetical protein